MSDIEKQVDIEPFDLDNINDPIMPILRPKRGRPKKIVQEETISDKSQEKQEPQTIDPILMAIQQMGAKIESRFEAIEKRIIEVENKGAKDLQSDHAQVIQNSNSIVKQNYQHNDTSLDKKPSDEDMQAVKEAADSILSSIGIPKGHGTMVHSHRKPMKKVEATCEVCGKKEMVWPYQLQTRLAGKDRGDGSVEEKDAHFFIHDRCIGGRR